MEKHGEIMLNRGLTMFDMHQYAGTLFYILMNWIDSQIWSQKRT